MSAVRAWCALPLLIALCLWGCACGCNDAILARLDRGRGDVAQQPSGASGWTAATSGAEFRMGDGLRTGAGAQAELSFLPDGRMRVEADTVIRFLERPPKASGRMEVERGAVEVEAATAAVEIVTNQGTTHLEKGSKVAIRSTDKQVQLEVLVGRVLALESGKVAEAGERLRLTLGQVVVEPLPPEESASSQVTPTSALPPDPAEPSAPQADLAITAGLEAEASDAVRKTQAVLQGVEFLSDPSQWDLLLQREGAITIHDPVPPTRVGFETPPCASAVSWELRSHGKWARLERRGTPVAALSPGTYLYRLRCPGKRWQRGSLRILRDAAVQQLPKTAPGAQLDADGRKYTVRYQNLLPILKFRWPTAPKSSGYHLEIARKGRESRRFRGSVEPLIELPSGALAEGTYDFRMVAAGGRSSPRSEVTVTFDNAARTAYISSPKERDFAPGDLVWVRGAVLAGSRVEANGEAMALGSGGRFAKRTNAGPNSILIQVYHPHSGTHYYLRRPSSGP